jgi:two-component system, cell cycle response regulator DivK
MPKKVMIVEDNELNLKLFTDLLRAHQFIVEGVRDGRLALEQARMFAPDLVIMDIQLPHVSGIDLIEAMQKDAALAAIPVLAVTAYAGKGDEERIRAAGARGYLSKPVSVMKFLEAVRGIIG